jgi:selenide,water dikinase
LTGLFPTENYPDLLVGLEAPDDAAVYRLNAEQAIISTVDFFPPVVDDPYAFGAIAAANALSDVYAMGGEPLVVINLAAFPDSLDVGILSDILMGGAEKVREAGAVVAGGHTVTDNEPKYGLAVTGIVHPDRIVAKQGARPGDSLVLTKALGTGVITTALKHGAATVEHVERAIASMSRLNQKASRIAQSVGVRSMTDITGYSLLGHGHEMAHLSRVNLRIQFGRLQWLPGAQVFAENGAIPGGTSRNRAYFEQWVLLEANLDDVDQTLLYDPQTSGGLLMSVPGDRASALVDQLVAAGEVASVIGEVIPGDGHVIVH